MKKTILLAALLNAGIANAALITDENFEGGATGWNNNTTTVGSGVFTEFLGRHGGTGGNNSLNKSYALSGTQTEVTIEFDFMEIDSWDGESFSFFVDGALLFSDRFQLSRNDFAGSHAQSLLHGNGTEDLGFSSTWSDQIFHYSITVNTSLTSLAIGFGTGLNQSIADESWGIDNVRITDNSQVSSVPEPATLGLIALGMAGIGFSNRKKAA